MPKSKKPPAKIRYDQSHPTVSFRLDLDTKERLKDALEGQSFASFIKDALEPEDDLEDELEGSPDEIYDEGHAEGYKKGSEEGYKKGSEDGYKKGSEDGYKRGSEEGYKRGLEDRHKASFEEGCMKGFNDGFAKASEIARE